MRIELFSHVKSLLFYEIYQAADHVRQNYLFLVCIYVTRRIYWCSIEWNFSQRIHMKMEFNSQKEETFLFLNTKIAAVTSSANQQFARNYCWML